MRKYEKKNIFLGCVYDNIVSYHCRIVNCEQNKTNLSSVDPILREVLSMEVSFNSSGFLGKGENRGNLGKKSSGEKFPVFITQSTLKKMNHFSLQLFFSS